MIQAPAWVQLWGVSRNLIQIFVPMLSSSFWGHPSLDSRRCKYWWQTFTLSPITSERGKRIKQAFIGKSVWFPNPILMTDYAILMTVSIGDDHNRTRQDIFFCFCCCFLSLSLSLFPNVRSCDDHTPQEERQPPCNDQVPVIICLPFSCLLFLIVVITCRHNLMWERVVIKWLIWFEVSLMTSNCIYLSGTAFSPVVVNCPSHRFREKRREREKRHLNYGMWNLKGERLRWVYYLSSLLWYPYLICNLTFSRSLPSTSEERETRGGWRDSSPQKKGRWLTQHPGLVSRCLFVVDDLIRSAHLSILDSLRKRGGEKRTIFHSQILFLSLPTCYFILANPD